MRGGAGVATLTQIAGASCTPGANNPAVTMPTVQAGDIAVWVDIAYQTSGGPPAAAVPTGFTQIASTTVGGASDNRMISAIKLCNGTESGSSLTGMNATAAGQAVRQVVTFRGDVAVTAINVQDVASQSTDADPTAQVVSALGGTTPLLILGFYTGFATVGTRSMTPAKDGERQLTGTGGGSAGDSWIAWKFYNVGSTPADVTVDMGDVGSDNGLHSCYVLCT